LGGGQDVPESGPARSYELLTDPDPVTERPVSEACCIFARPDTGPPFEEADMTPSISCSPPVVVSETHAHDKRRFRELFAQWCTMFETEKD
jgi:hypothetical protein